MGKSKRRDSRESQSDGEHQKKKSKTDSASEGLISGVEGSSVDSGGEGIILADTVV
jgi:hypothetical protein